MYCILPTYLHIHKTTIIYRISHSKLKECKPHNNIHFPKIMYLGNNIETLHRASFIQLKGPQFKKILSIERNGGCKWVGSRPEPWWIQTRIHLHRSKPDPAWNLYVVHGILDQTPIRKMDLVPNLDLK